MVNISGWGVLFDIVGAVMLGGALSFAGDNLLKVQAGTYFGFNSAALNALAEQRIDARFGLAVLVGGFVLQFAGTICTTSPTWISWLLGPALVVTVIAYFASRDHLVRTDFERLRSELRAEKEE